MSAPFGRLLPVVVSVATLAATLPIAPAWAQDKPDAKAAEDKKAAAKEHYTRGTSFYDLGRYDDAIREFEAAYQLKNDPAFLYNLAQSYRQAGRPEQALHFYKTYLRYVPKPANKADIEEKIKALEQQVAQRGGGTAPPPVGTTPPPGTTAPPVNTTPPPPAGDLGAVPLPPGTPPPYPSGDAQPGALGPPVTTTEVTTTDRGRVFRIAGLASAATGGLLYLGAIIMWRRAVAASDEVEADARNGLPFNPDTQDRGQSAEAAQWWFFLLGTLAVGAGAGLWYYGNRMAPGADTTTWRISAAPAIGPRLGGATLRITF